ncbi:hypothetical protein GF318_05090 [Candidatus Micrarchaeota archaeon]|nr:hypothetical protein [Candidatus Micrarchaeota archaeon]
MKPGWLEKEMEDARSSACDSIIRNPRALQFSSKNVRHYTLGEMLERDSKFAKKAISGSRSRLPGPHASAVAGSFSECNFFLVPPNKKASLEFLCDHSLSLNFVFLAENSVLRLFTTIASQAMDLVGLELEPGSSLKAGLLKYKGHFAYHGQAAAASSGASISTASFWGGSGRGEVASSLTGLDASAMHLGLSIGGGSEKLNLDSSVVHSSHNTASEVVMRGVAQDSSATEFRGNVTVESNGKGSKSRLEQQILLLDKNAQAGAEPVLEIKHNEVECSHSAAVRKIEEEKLFYLMSRGLSRKRAKTTMVTGFLRSTINRIQDRELKNRFMPPFMRD